MPVHAVFASSRTIEGAEIDAALRVRFGEVYRVGVEFWLVDTAMDAEMVTVRMQEVMGGRDKMFAAALTRDVSSMLSAAAMLWLNAPHRGWGNRGAGRGEAPADYTFGSLLAPAAGGGRRSNAA